MKDASIYIVHILENVADIELFLKDVTKSEFMNNKEKQNAVMRSLEIIGEASKFVPVQTKEQFRNVEWKQISGTRDILIHQYFGVDLDIIWDIATIDVQKLKKELQHAPL